MSLTIEQSVRRRGITRLCHFTPSRNLVHIVSDERGLLATKRLKEDERAAFNSTDLERLDGLPDHVCCSIQYPNAWYFRKAQGKDLIFRDWVVLLLRPDYIWLSGTKFCPRNAAAVSGRYVREGEEAFEAMFALSVIGSRNKIYSRGPSHPRVPPD